MNKFWSRLARGLVPYVPGEQPQDKKYIKLNTNENPYGPSPKVIEAVRNAVDGNLRLYPDPTSDLLINAAAEFYGVGKECIFAGNGSDEVLAFSFMAFFDPERKILFPEITYSFYPVYASLFGLSFDTVPLDCNFGISVEKFIGSEGGVVIANPNAPTGKALPLRDIIIILEGNPDCAVIIDEAYVDFGAESAVGLIDKYPNLLIIQTLSKSRSLAGMRIGFAIGDRNLIKALENIKNSFNSYTLDKLAIIAGAAALGDTSYYREINGRIIAAREKFTGQLRERGFDVVDSKANFVFASHKTKSAEMIFKQLRKMGILVRYFKKPVIDNYLRITIGTGEEMDKVIEALDCILDTDRTT